MRLPDAPREPPFSRSPRSAGDAPFSRLLLPILLLPVFLLLPAPVLSGQTAEDQNDDRWLRVETEHFILVYQAAYEEAAREVLQVADRVYRDTTSYLAYRPRERIPVMLYGGTARANGFFSPYPPHIALFVSSPVGPWIGARTESWIETVFVHELIHYLHLTRPIGFFGAPSRLFGPLLAATGTLFMPGWAVEGIAVHGESHLAAGGRGDNPFFEMQAIAPVLEERMYSYDQAGSPSSYAPRGRIYTGGYLMVDYLLHRHGERAFVMLNRSFQRAPFLGMRRAIRRTTGTGAADLFAEMVADLEQRYAWRHELPRGTLVSPNGPGDWFLPASTERGLITWGRDFDRGPGFYLYRDGSWHLLAPVHAAEEWSWTVDRTGTRAVVSITGPAPGAGGPAPATGESFSDLFLVELDRNRDGSERRDYFGPAPSRRITRGHRLFHPALSPTGTQLVAVERRGSYSRLVEVDLETGSVAPIWEPDRVTLGATTFSPDGTLLALTVNDRGRQGLALLEAESGTVLGESFAARSDNSRTGAPALYFPRFVGTHRDEGDQREQVLELWYGGDWNGELALYRSVITRENGDLGAPRLVLRDQVAAWSGLPDPTAVPANSPDKGTPVIYGSYTADGFAIKRGTMQSAASERSSAPAPIPALAGSGRSAPESLPSQSLPVPDPRPYRDLPRPVLWLPQAALRSGGDGEDQFDVGIFATAVSNLGRHAIDLSLLYNPEAHQPSGTLSYTFSPGRTRWNALVSQEYRVSGDPLYTEQETSLALVASRPLWFDLHAGYYRVLTGRAGVEYQVTSRVPGETRFRIGLDGDGAEITRQLEALTQLRLARVNTGAVRDFFGPTGRDLTAVIEAAPALLDRETMRFETTIGGAVRTQPLRRYRGMTGGLQLVPAGYITGSTAGTALDRLPYRSGGFTDRHTAGGEADLGWLGRMELRMPLGIHDAARRGVAVTGSGLALYLEQGGAVTGGELSGSNPGDDSSSGNDDPTLVPADFAVAGAEFALDLFFNMIPLRVTTGTAVRLPHPGSSVNRDWLFYLRLGGPVAEVVGDR